MNNKFGALTGININSVEDTFPILAAGSLMGIRNLENEYGKDISYFDFLNHPHLRNLAYSLSILFGSEAMSASLCVSAFHLLLHERHGKRVYDIDPELAIKLKYTEIRGLRTEDLRLPYPAIYISVPSELGMKLWNEDTGEHRCIGIFIYEDRTAVGSSTSSYFPPERKDLIERCWRILMVGDDKNTITGNDALEFYNIILYSDMSLDECIGYARRELNYVIEHKFTNWNRNMAESWEEIFKWAMNCVIYATWSNPGEHVIMNKEARQLWDRIKKLPKKSSKAKDLRRRFNNLDAQRRIRLSVVKRGSSSSQAPFLSNNLNIHHVCVKVSGHWKNVAYGTQLKERRLKWIEPYWRNKDSGEEEVIRKIMR